MTQSADRSRPHETDFARTLTPKGIFFHTGRVRKLLGLESLRLQGIVLPPCQEADVLSTFDDAVLHDLGGNAFSCHCLYAVMLAGLAQVAAAYKDRAFAHRGPHI